MTDSESTPRPVPDATFALPPTPTGVRRDWDGPAAIVPDRSAPDPSFRDASFRDASFPDPSFRDPAALNRTHDMAGLRSRGGIVVRSIEERRRDLVALRVRRSLPDDGTGVVADIGCEDGWIARAYAADARETILVDVDPAVLGRALASSPVRCRAVVADARARGAVPASSVDVVVLSAILEHVPDPDAVLAAWAPALREGGRFVVYVPADRPILALKRVLRATRLGGLVRGISLDPAPGHVRTFSRRSLVRLLKPFGVLEEVEFDPAVLGYAATVRVARPPSLPVAGR